MKHSGEQTSLRVGPFWHDAEAYHGVLARDGDQRLTVSPNGARYTLQALAAQGGPWIVKRWRKSLALLMPDLPAGLVGPWLDGLPDDPREFVRPWAEETKALSERFLATKPWYDGYSGVLQSSDRVRVVLLPDRRRYAAQIKSGERWADVCVSISAARLWKVAAGVVDAGRRARPVVGSAVLSVMAQRLPAFASDCSRRIESAENIRAEVRAAVGDVAEAPAKTACGAVRRSGGQVASGGGSTRPEGVLPALRAAQRADRKAEGRAGASRGGRNGKARRAQDP